MKKFITISSIGRSVVPVILLGLVLALVVADVSFARGGFRGGGFHGGGMAMRGGGGGFAMRGGGMARHSVAAGNRGMGHERGFDRGDFAGNSRVGESNIDDRNNTNVNINGGHNNHGGRGHGRDCCYHGGIRYPVLTGMVIGAMAVTTAAVIGSYYYALPPICTTVFDVPDYYYCGSVYYQRTWSGNDVVYVVVDAPG